MSAPGCNMTLDAARQLAGLQGAGCWRSLTGAKRPAPLRDYREAVEHAKAGGNGRLAEAVRRIARDDLEVLRRREKGLGPDAARLRVAAGLPTAAEDYQEHGAFFPRPAGAER